MAAHILFLLALLLPSFAGEKVEIKLKTGKTVSGELLKDGKDEIILATDFGTLLIKKSKIESRNLLVGAGKGQESAKKGQAAAQKGKPEAAKKDDPFELEKIVADVESRAKKKAGEEKAGHSAAKDKESKQTDGTAKALTKAPGSMDAHSSAGPGGRANPGPESTPHGAIYGGRLLDRFDWANKLEMGTKFSIFAALYLLFWGALSVLTRLLDVENASSGKSAMAALIWVAVIVGMLLVPNPTHVILGILGFCLLVAWLMTTRGILGASWIQSVYLFLLGSLGVLLLYLLVEVGSNILELKV